MKINLDDPNLTAFALGQLSGPDRAAMERVVASSPEAQKFVSETQQLAQLLKSEYAADGHFVPERSQNIQRFQEQQRLWYSGQWGSLAAVFAIFAILGAFAVSAILRYGGNVSHKRRAIEYEYLPAVEAVSDAPSESQRVFADSQRSKSGLPGGFDAENPFLPAGTNPLSTFSMDVGSGSYSNVQRLIDSGALPTREIIRVEEMINYFTYDYRQPEGDKPFSIDLDATACPWDANHRLLRIGLKGREGTTMTIASDVKVQVEFNPVQVASYRLIGYEKQNPSKDDSGHDKVDGAEVGAGHTVTALYEIVPSGSGPGVVGSVAPISPLKYQQQGSAATSSQSDPTLAQEVATVKLRYKRTGSESGELLEQALVDNGSKFEDASPDLKFAAAVAEFAMILRDSQYKGTGTLRAVIEWAEEGKGGDAAGNRAGFIELVRKTEALKPGEG